MTATKLALAFCVGGYLSATASAGVTVTLKSRAVPPSTIVRIGDVAKVVADGPADAVNATRLRSVPLAPAPAEGRTTTLSAETVRDRASAGGFAVTLAGAKSVTLTSTPSVDAARESSRAASPGDRAYAEKFVTAAVSRALTRSGAPSMRIEVAVAPDVARTIARQRPDGCDLTGLTPTPNIAQTVTLRWLDRLENVTTVDAAVRLDPPRLVPVLTEPVPRGAPITAEHVSWRAEGAEDSAFVPSTMSAPPSSIALAGGNRPAVVAPPVGFAARLPTGEAVRDLPAGSVLDADDLRQTPLVRANQTVRVESHVGGITVSRDLKATRNGLLGQTIPLTDPEGSSFDRRNQIYARVVGNRRAVLVGDAAATPAYADRAAYADPQGGTR
ncbi:flagella basal body P-ring formation protein FlgA [Alienimonas chondri]|uniref:Flagella basal body P-ring formation protein FlgA SAF domain-containing protein n=1 Tax=Alienimonas chondri TaxID=2681879 RepID=A0ABX1VHA9_9PLAN|nr:flagella basal body P-ring formation protein FlgA [Alienimonas chondri]NNJ26856.1 hypothetical protein [Alienimonas chondri]